MKRIAIALAASLLGVGLLLAGTWLALLPPHFAVPAKHDWVFRDVTLVEAGSAPRPGSTLRVVGGVLANEASPQAVEATDLAGLYVAPGLSDLHVHYPPQIAIGNTKLWSLLLLAHGVTSIRETGSIDGSIFAVREAIRAGRTPGPRIFACGEMLDGPDPSFPSNRVVRTAEEGRAAVASLAARGADCIKAYNMLSPGALAGIREAAAEAGLPLIGHVPHAVDFEVAGLVDLQHGTGAVIIDRDRVGRSDFRSEDWQTMDAARIAYVSRVSLALDIAHTPTLVNARMRRLLADEALARAAMESDSGLRHLPRLWSAAWSAIWTAPFVAGNAESEATHTLFRKRQAMMTAGLHAAGVRIHAGTDTLMPFVAPGSSLHGELADLVAAGIADDDVWEIATRGAGRALGVPGLGTLDPGAPADLIFLRSDPTGRIPALQQIEAVLADGRLYRRAELDAMLAAADAHFRGAFYETAMGTVVTVARSRFAPERDPAQAAEEHP